MSKLYLECRSGISGDMFVASLLDLGADRQVLMDVLKTVPAKGFEIKISRVKKAGLDVCDFDVVLDEEHENHDHDMAYLMGHEHAEVHEHVHEHSHGEEHDHVHEHSHGADHGHTHEHSHGEDHGHTHEHSHGEDHGHAREHSHEDNHSHAHHHHEHRGLADVIAIIDQTHMTDRAKETAKRIFTILGKAEAKSHGTTLEEVHFHEVGAVDSIVDIISAAVCLDNLDVTETIIPVLYEGYGSVRCAHGVLSVPVPAVSNIAADHKLPLYITDVEGELVTPTGAAIAAAIRTSGTLPEKFSIERIGMGAGKREYERPSMVRAMLIKVETDAEKSGVQKDTIYKLESNVDDCTGENLGYVMERLFAAGARDVNYTPLFMKKNRPAYQLNVICTPEDVERMEEIIFTETTTIGIRKMQMERSVLDRRTETIETPIGEAEIKICKIHGTERIYPEYRSVTTLCEKTGKSFREVFHLIEMAAENHESKGE